MQSKITTIGWIWAVASIGAYATPSFAAPHEVRIALHDGRLHCPDLAVAICREMHLSVPDISGGDIDLSGLRGSRCIQGCNDALGDGWHLRIDAGALVLRVDPEKLPRHIDDARRAIRVFTIDADPADAAKQASHWGIFLPDGFDDRRPLVVLIHGLDSAQSDMAGLGKLLADDGYQVAYFAYPCDQPIYESAQYFANQMEALRRKFPTLKVNIVAHSMGGLVARTYVEGDEYAGGVDHLILVGTPNGGSSWAAGQVLLKVNQEYHDWKTDPQWRWTWAITDGLGEAGRDLKPRSKFLQSLNARPRRAGVTYTIVAGNQNAATRLSANIADAAVRVIPKKSARWWGVRQCETAIAKCGEHLRNKTGSGDGPVSLASVKLAGVDDVAIVRGDHATLICFDHGNPPAAWAVIRDRLSKEKD